MNKNLLIIMILSIGLLFGGVWLLSSKQESPKTLAVETKFPENLEYYWAEECSHCAVVADFLEGWKKSEEIIIDKKEVSKNTSNQTTFKQRGDYCKIPTNKQGVPMLFTPDGECITGDTPIIEYLKTL